MDTSSLNDRAAADHGNAAAQAASLELLARGSGLKPLRLCGRDVLPVVQGGMGIGVSGKSVV